MKQVILLRHAKAHPSRGESDHERTLDARGLADAARVGAMMAERGWLPGVVLVSDARRTLQTVDTLATTFARPPAVRIEPRLYAATPDTIVRLVRATDAGADRVLVFGHNPGIAEAARRLAADGAADDMARLRSSFPTSCAAVVRFDVMDWRHVGWAGGWLEACHWVDPPSG